jgi:hypothetical protein
MHTATRFSRAGAERPNPTASTIDICRAIGLGVVAAVLAGSLLVARPAQAASFINRGLTLPSSTFELGLGLGLAHLDAIDYTGLGVNMELGYGLNQKLELRFRTGLRFGQDGRTTQADYFGHPVETESYNPGGESVRNPEIGLRLDLVNGGTAELALDARIYLPIDGDFGFLFGIPVALHLGSRARLDTGVFMPIILSDNTQVDISLPLHLWFRLDGGTFLGPMTGVVFHDGGSETIPFGVGFGTSLAYDADLRFWFLFPNIDNGGADDYWGTGVGLYVTF